MKFSIADLVHDVADELLDDARGFYAARPAGAGPQTLDELTEVRAKRKVQHRDPLAVVVNAEYAGRAVPVRVLTPESSPTGVVLDIHGGGFYLDSADRNDKRNRDLVNALGVAVVSVDYRLAPESPWPAAPDDCETAARWLIDTVWERFGTDRLLIRGASAGATLAMTTLLRLRDRGLTDEFAGAVLEFGTYDLSGTTPAGRRIADEYFLAAYLADAPDRTVPDISPIFADLHDLPATLIVVGADDVLLEDNLVMAARLSAAGNDVDLRVYPEVPHGFTGHKTLIAQSASKGTEDWVAQAVAAPPGEPWDEESLKAVRAATHTDPATLIELLADRSPRDVAQLIGDAVLRALDADVAGADALARELVKSLTDRDWDGDHELSDQLRGALGDSPTSMLRPAIVDLQDLGNALDDGRGDGGHLNVDNGELWRGDLSWYSEDELPDFEDDCWLGFSSMGAGDSYRDMEDFIDTVADPDLAARLHRAISGKGAFRRFKNELFDHEVERTAYFRLKDERERGRARQWLASEGYRVAGGPFDSATV